MKHKLAIYLVVGAVIVLLGYILVTSMQSPSNSQSTNYNIGGLPSSPSTPSDLTANNSIEIPVITSSQVPGVGTLYSAQSQNPNASSPNSVIKGTGQYAGDKWIVNGPGAGTHIQAQ